MSTISKLPYRQYKFGNSSLPLRNINRINEKKIRQQNNVPQNTFCALSKGKNEYLDKHLYNLASNKSNTSLNGLTFSNGIFGHFKQEQGYIKEEVTAGTTYSKQNEFGCSLKQKDECLTAIFYDILCFSHSEIYAINLDRDADGRLGFSLSPINNCEVDGITKGSPAAKGGLKIGDILVSINYQKVNTTKEVVTLMESTGDSITLKYYKKGMNTVMNTQIAHNIFEVGTFRRSYRR